MAHIKLDYNRPLKDGISVSFKAPCDCAAVDGLCVYYDNGGSLASKVFTFRDSHGNDLTRLGNLFSEGACIRALLDVVNGYAYLENADTNAYLESKFDTKQNKLSWATDADIDAMFNGTYTESGEGGDDDDPDGDEEIIDDKTVDFDTTWSSKKIRDEIIKAASYQPLVINTFKVTPDKAELGSTVESATFEWALNAVPTSVKIGDKELQAKQSGTYTVTAPIYKAATFTLSAADGITTAQPKTCGINFYNGVYYGVAPAPADIDSKFVRSLANKEIRSNKVPDFTVDAKEGEYIWYCVPVKYGECTFVDFDTKFGAGMRLVKTIKNFENMHGYDEDDYYVYRSGYDGLGKSHYTVS